MQVEESSRPIHKPTLRDALISTRTIRILLAEDDHEMRALLTAALKKEGYEVTSVADGNELLSVLGSRLSSDSAQRTTDLIIADIRMPGHTGLEVLAGLRRSGWQTPILLITAFGDAETHAEARRLGATASMDKPFELDDLKTVLLNMAFK